MTEEQWFDSMDDFHRDDPARLTSPEWDYGVMWMEREGKLHPQWRVSWVCQTGEVYALELAAPGRVILLGDVPPVGEYPFGGHHRWGEWAKGQSIDRVLAGWADDPIVKPLDWVRDRLRSREARLARERALLA
jgi:hypothetical protein